MTNLPPDHLFPVGAAQLFQHRTDPMIHGFFGDSWDFADRTPLAAAATASVLSSAGVTLPRPAIWTLPARELRPTALDDLGYWQAHLVLVLLNAIVVVAIARLAWSLWGRRAALLAGLLAAANPFVFTHVFFTWPKLLAAAFVLLHYTYVRERRSPVLVGVTAGLAYLAHPLAALFVLPSLLVACCQGRRRAVGTLGVAVATILPWQIWTALAAHTSRMLTYPLGYTMRDPADLGGELRVAWDQFRLGHALRVRLQDVIDTVWPFDLRRNLLSLPGRSMSGSEAWFTAHDRTLGGMMLFVLVPVFVIGVIAWWRMRRGELLWMLVAPLALAVLFWGIDPQGLGSGLLQPAGALLVVIVAGGLLVVRRAIGVTCVVLAGLEAASVVWWGLFAARDGAGGGGIAVAAALYALPVLGAVVTVGRWGPRRGGAADGRRGDDARVTAQAASPHGVVPVSGGSRVTSTSWRSMRRSERPAGSTSAFGCTRPVDGWRTEMPSTPPWLERTGSRVRRGTASTSSRGGAAPARGDASVGVDDRPRRGGAHDHGARGGRPPAPVVPPRPRGRRQLQNARRRGRPRRSAPHPRGRAAAPSRRRRWRAAARSDACHAAPSASRGVEAMASSSGSRTSLTRL